MIAGLLRRLRSGAVGIDLHVLSPQNRKINVYSFPSIGARFQSAEGGQGIEIFSLIARYKIKSTISTLYTP